MTEKQCTGCGVVKSLEEFFRDSSNKSTGRNSRCKVCHQKAVFSWRSRNAEQVVQQNAARLKEWRVANKVRYHEHAKAWAARNGERYKQIQREYAQANREKIAPRQRAWLEKNRTRVVALRKKSREKHRDKEAAYARAWNAAHPERVNANTRRRFARKLRATPAWANEFFMVEAYHLARLRTKATGFRWEVDHIVPLRCKTVCGLHCEHNLQVIPHDENRRKSNIRWPEMP